ncbi:hypothetical protein [Sediminicoccus sp. KRV36]|uniref:hypothetical protein n=1 Tax=Sediminicoccus sp. KRV36 TaxID=3133721 RepID=UPI00200F7772|nr:hypothetical protein [Sediminicoccus rosea]UPY37187.1 hypothetical protein LHU95_00390 [Sediminicoccus rosea]
MRQILLAALLLLPMLAHAQEPAAVTQLRRLLGADVTLSFDRATATDVAGSAVLSGAVLRRQNESIRITEARLEGLRDDGIARLSLRGIAISGGDLPVTLERLDLEGLAIRRPAAGKTVQPGDVTADLLRLEGWRSTGPAPVNIGGLSIEGFGAGRTGQASLTALEILAPQMGVADRLTIARIAYAGLDAADLLGAVIAQRAPRRAPGRQSLEIEGVALSQGAAPIARLSALTLRGEITAGRPQTGAFALRGLEVMPTPPIADWMQRLGYATLGAEARLEATHDVTAQLLELSEFGIELRDVGELNLAFRADRVPEDMDASGAQSARLLSARLRYADRSVFQRWVRTQAAQERIAEAAFRQRLIGQSAAMLAGPRLADARNAVARFLRGEATVLELVAQPRAPLPISQISGKPQSSLDGWRDMFGLTLTAR